MAQFKLLKVSVTPKALVFVMIYFKKFESYTFVMERI